MQNVTSCINECPYSATRPTKLIDFDPDPWPELMRRFAQSKRLDIFLAFFGVLLQARFRVHKKIALSGEWRRWALKPRRHTPRVFRPVHRIRMCYSWLAKRSMGTAIKTLNQAFLPGRVIHFAGARRALPTCLLQLAIELSPGAASSKLLRAHLKRIIDGGEPWVPFVDGSLAFWLSLFRPGRADGVCTVVQKGSYS